MKILGELITGSAHDIVTYDTSRSERDHNSYFAVLIDYVP